MLSLSKAQVVEGEVVLVNQSIGTPAKLFQGEWAYSFILFRKVTGIVVEGAGKQTYHLLACDWFSAFAILNRQQTSAAVALRCVY
jgi:hypothetical protein